MDYLRGETATNSKIILSTWIDTVAYFLTYSATDQELIFISNPVDDNIVIADLNSFGTDTVSLEIIQPSNLNSWIGATNVSGRYWATLTKQEGLTYTNNQFQPWTFPLTGVNYAFQQAGFTVNWRIILDASSTAGERIVSGIRVVPFVVYPLGGCTKTLLTISEIVKNEQDAAMSGKVQQYFTDSLDCNDGLFYDYCPTGTDCGTNCKSPCSLATDACNLDKTNDTFSCSNINPGGSGLTPVGIGLAVFVALIVIVVIWLGLLQLNSSTPYYRINV